MVIGSVQIGDMYSLIAQYRQADEEIFAVRDVGRYAYLILVIAAVAYQFVGTTGAYATVFEQLGQNRHAVQALGTLYPALERLAAFVVIIEVAYHDVGIVL